MNFQSDKDLVKKARKDHQAFALLFDRYYPNVFRYTLKRVANVQVAEDITAEVFYIVLKKLWQFRWRNIPFEAWIMKIARNEIYFFFRKQKYKPLSLEYLLEETALELADQQDFQEEIIANETILEEQSEFLFIHKKLQTLPMKYREILVLRFLEKKKIKDIARFLQKKEGTVKSLLSRGLILLKKELHNEKLLQRFSPGSIMPNERSLTEKNL